MRARDPRLTRSWPLPAAALLTALVAVVMLAVGGAARAVFVLVLVAAQVGLYVVVARGARPSAVHRVLALWSAQAGLTWLVAGDRSTTSVLVYLGVGLVFALVAEAVLRLVGRGLASPADAAQLYDTAPLPNSDTAPLPEFGFVQDAERDRGTG